MSAFLLQLIADAEYISSFSTCNLVAVNMANVEAHTATNSHGSTVILVATVPVTQSNAIMEPRAVYL